VTTNNLTRIKNNQITVNTIDYTRLVPGTLVGSVFNPNLTLNSNVTIIGNLSVGGNTSTINSVNTYIQDPLVTFNNGYTGSLTNYDIGIIVNRNWASLAGYGSVNTAFVWDENAGAFLAIATSTSGNAITGLTNSGFANVKLGNLTSNSATITTGGITVSVGAITAATGGLQNTPIGSTTASTGAFTTLTSTTTTPVNLNATNGNVITLVATNFSTGNAVITGGSLTGLTSGSFTQLTSAYLNATSGFATANAVITGGSVNSTPIGAATPSTGAFTTITSTGTSIHSGNIVAASGTASTSTTTGALVVQGGTGISGNLTVAGPINLTNTTQNTGIGTGALQLAGGAYIAGNLYVAGNINAIATSISTNYGAFYGNTGGAGALFAGITGGYLPEPQAIVQSTANMNNYAGIINGQNINAGPLASTDVFLSPNNGTLNDTYLDMGIASSTYNYPGYSLIKPNDAYLFNWGNATTGGGNLIIGTGYTNDIVFSVQGINTNNEVMRITQANVVAIKSTNVSTTTTTGALTVAGGVGVVGDVNIGGNLKVSGTLTYINTTTELVSGVEIVAGNLVANSGTASSSTSTGALVVVGGAGVSGAIYAGSVQNTPIGSTTASTGAFTQLAGQYVNATSGFATANAVITGGSTTGMTSGSFTTLQGTNLSSGNAVITGGSVNSTPIGATTASTGTFTTALVTTGFSTANAVITGGSVNSTPIGAASASTGAFTQLAGQYVNATTGFATGNAVITGGSTTGMTSGSFTTLQGTNFSSGNAVITGGSVNGTPIGATTAAAGTFTTLVTSGTSIHAGNLVANATTPTTTVTTGALVVAGGAGFGANVLVNTGANVNVSRAVGADFYVAGANDTTVLWAHSGASYDSVTVGGAGNTASLATGAKFIVNSNDSMILPHGDNAGRPGTPVEGMFRYSYASHAIEWWNGTIWQSASTSFTPVTDQTITADGVNNTFSMSPYGTTAASMVSINGVVQIPTIAYSTFSGNNNIVFSEVPSNGDIIDIRIMTSTTTVSALQSTTGKAQVAVDDTNGVQVITGSSGLTATVTTSWTIGGQMVSNIANVSVSSANTLTTVDTMDNTQYRSAKYMVQATNGANYQVAEALVLSNGTTASIVNYGIVQTNGNLGVLTATQSGSNTLVQFVAANASTTVRVYPVYMRI